MSTPEEAALPLWVRHREASKEQREQVLAAFLLGTGCTSPEEAVARDLRTVEDWCEHLTRYRAAGELEGGP